MKRKILYLAIGIWCIGFTACTHDSDEPNPVLKDELSRSAITLERTVTLTTPGTLQEQVEAAMAGEDVSTLQKLTIVGSYNGKDVQYWKTALTNLIEFDLKEAVPTYVEGQNIYFDPYGNEMNQGDNEIGAHSFSFMEKIELIVFPDCIEHIQYEACNGCSNLMSIKFGDNLKSIQNFAFNNCNILDNIEFPSSLQEIFEYAFTNTGITSIIIPSSVTNLRWDIFNSCSQLESVKLLANIESIPNSMFYNCTKLESVELSSTIKEVGDNAFEYCISLKDYSPFININKINWYSFAHTGFEFVDLSNFDDSSNAINAFRECLSLKEVKLPDNLKSLPSGFIEGCSELKKINIPSAMETLSGFNGIGITEIVIPNTVKHIGESAFSYNQSLVSVILPEGLETIGNYAFYGTGIESIVIPTTVTTLGYSALGNTKLKSLHVPETVTIVYRDLVWGCHNLQYIKWDSPAELLDCDNVNTNCYVYLANENIGCGPNWNNVIININGEYVAESVTLCEGGQRDNQSWSYSVPIAFKAKKIKYERRFGDYDWQGEYITHPGECSGWQTIVLPFTPTEIKHETKGNVAPFNHLHISEKDAKPFWLRELTSEGFKDVTEMKPNTAYIIAMPNHDSYLEEYRLYGKITFSATDVTLSATSDGNSEVVYSASAGPEYDLQPTYHYVERSSMVYALNTTYWIDGYHYGSVFAKESSDVYAFEAYVSVAGRLARSTFGIDTSSSNTRSAKEKNATGIPQIGDM